jgi:hypothetical protein
MDQVVQPINTAIGNAVASVVYVKEEPGQARQPQVVPAMEQDDGIAGLEFCALGNHLVLATYNKTLFSSRNVLRGFHSLKLDARLIGSV